MYIVNNRTDDIQVWQKPWREMIEVWNPHHIKFMWNYKQHLENLFKSDPVAILSLNWNSNKIFLVKNVSKAFYLHIMLIWLGCDDIIAFLIFCNSSPVSFLFKILKYKNKIIFFYIQCMCIKIAE